MGAKLVLIAEKTEAGCRLGLFLRRRGLSTGTIRSIKYIPNGICVNGQQAKTNYLLAEGDHIQITEPEKTEPSVPPQDIPLEVLYESAHAMLINKQAGLVVHPTRSHKQGTVANAYCFHMQEMGRVGTFRPVGRLDADTSGLLLIAQNMFAADGMAKSLKKIYLALVAGSPKQAKGQIEAPLAPAVDSLIRQCVSPDGKKSVTEYFVLQSSAEASLALVRPLTGRTHQIRAHFAYIGCPLLGDGLYGGAKEYINRHALHCAGISFAEPQQQARVFTASLPADFQNACKKAGLPGWQEKVESMIRDKL